MVQLRRTYLVCRGTLIDGGAPGYYSVFQTTDKSLAISLKDTLNNLIDNTSSRDLHYDFEDRFARSLGGKNIKFGYEEGGTGKFYIEERDVVTNVDSNDIDMAISEALKGSSHG